MAQMQRPLTTEEAAEYLQVTVDTVRRYIREGRLRASRLGREYRIRQEDLDAFLDPSKFIGSDKEFKSWVEAMKSNQEEYPMPAQVASARVFRYKAALREYSEARRGAEPDRYWRAMLLVVTAADSLWS